MRGEMPGGNSGLQGRVAVVMGANHGIGAATARALVTADCCESQPRALGAGLHLRAAVG